LFFLRRYTVSRRVAVVSVFGFSAMVLQILALRLLLTVSSGNELDLAVTLSAWLLTTALGSLIGTKLTKKDLLGWSFLILGVLSPLLMVFTEIIRALLIEVPGEMPALSDTILTSLVLLLPIGALVGAQFPLCVRQLPESPQRVYAFESLGAFAGGLIFTILIIKGIQTDVVLFTVSVLLIITGVLLTRKRVFLILLLIPFVVMNIKASILRWTAPPNMLLIKKVDSPYAEIVLYRSGNQDSFYISGNLYYTYPEPQTDEIKVHLPMTMVRNPERVLIIGGSPSLLTEVLKYPIKEVVFLEVDPVLIKLAKEVLSKEDQRVIENPKVKFMREDARRFLRTNLDKKYDLLLLNLPPPSTASLNRFYTFEFFQMVKGRLSPEGMFCLKLATTSGYISNTLRLANGSVYRTLKEVFPFVETTSEEYGFFFASQSPIVVEPGLLIETFLQRQVSTLYFRPYVIEDAFSVLKTEMVKSILSESGLINRDSRPVAYIYNLLFWAEIQGMKWVSEVLTPGSSVILPLLVVLVVITAFVFFRKKKVINYLALSIGFSTMALSVVLILTYQSLYGYIYERIGLIVGTFMLGAFFGAILPERVNLLKNPQRRLLLVEILIVVFISTLFFILTSEAVFYIASFLAGLLGAVEFSLAASIVGRQRSGVLYASDLSGAILGATVAGLITIPLYGIPLTLTFIGMVKISAFVLLLQGRN
jgi:spermidine synthase